MTTAPLRCECVVAHRGDGSKWLITAVRMMGLDADGRALALHDQFACEAKHFVARLLLAATKLESEALLVTYAV
ncbi:MAG: hypothetical protein VX309_06490, partial [Pseudomonadota bacterium]|nr:hypothetical protein [Pseudomonadota bacterium]